LTAITAAALRLGEDLELPFEIVHRRTALTGQTGTGKTSTAVCIVEEARRAGAQVVVIDPSGAWYGITRSPDGNGPGVDMIVLGGEHGDVPLDEHAGRAVARLVADEGHSPILDLDRPYFNGWAPRQRFVADFLSELYERCHSQILVVIDEGHRFAPQGIRDESGHAARCLGAVNDVVGLGRRRGLGFVVITPRLAKLHKDVLELCEVVIAHAVRGNNDKAQLRGWLEEAGEDAKALINEISRLDQGYARVSAPRLGVEGTFLIRPKSTFDSSADNARALEPKPRADVDLDALRALLAETVERVEADDPGALRERVRQLEGQLKVAIDRGPDAADEVETQAERDLQARLDVALRRLAELEKTLERRPDVFGALLSIGGDAQKIADYARVLQKLFRPEDFTQDDGAARSAPASTEGVQSSAAPESTPLKAPGGGDRDPNGGLDGRRRSRGAGSDPSTALAAPANGQGSRLSVAARDLLEALAAFPAGLTREQLALYTGRKPRGGSWNTALKALSAGWVEQSGERVAPTAAALELFPGAQAPSPAALVALWRSKLPAAAQDLYDTLVEAYPDALTRDLLGDMTGRAPRGGSWNTAVKTLRTSGLVVDEGDRLRANPELMEVT
jgi:hypothetical protein